LTDAEVGELYNSGSGLSYSAMSSVATNFQINIGDAWKSKAERAHTRAVNACDYEYRDIDILAGLEWEEIFGNMVPTTVTI